MVLKNKMNLSLLIYTCITTFLFIYMLPFIFIGFSPLPEPGMLGESRCTVVDLISDPNKLPFWTELAVWFSYRVSSRLFLASGIVLIMLFTSIYKKSRPYSELVCHIALWINFVVFILNFFGLTSILIVI